MALRTCPTGGVPVLRLLCGSLGPGLLCHHCTHVRQATLCRSGGIRGYDTTSLPSYKAYCRVRLSWQGDESLQNGSYLHLSCTTGVPNGFYMACHNTSPIGVPYQWSIYLHSSAHTAHSTQIRRTLCSGKARVTPDHAGLTSACTPWTPNQLCTLSQAQLQNHVCCRQLMPATAAVCCCGAAAGSVLFWSKNVSVCSLPQRPISSARSATRTRAAVLNSTLFVGHHSPPRHELALAAPLLAIEACTSGHTLSPSNTTARHDVDSVHVSATAA
jgi:hypothetical protein